jgi:hypothetical protein
VSFRHLTVLSALTVASVLAAVAPTAVQAAPAPAAPPPPADIADQAGVKQYLVATLTRTLRAAGDLKGQARAYADLCKAHGSAAGAAQAQPQKVADLIAALRDSYQRIDSFGYEYVEGIVAGVPSLAHYDVELDSGVAAQGAGPDDAVAPVVIKAPGVTLDREGSLNNMLLEPTTFGTHDKFTAGSATLPGFDKPVGLPHPGLIVALADYAVDGYTRLLHDAKAWQPNDADCFQVLENMTPTLADYFEEWKETRTHGGVAPGGRFVAVSRVSDMRGIMSSVRLTWLALRAKVQAKDAALAQSITDGYDQILAFIDTVDRRDAAQKLSVEAIDALGMQARDKADKLTVQATQAAALLGIKTSAH